VIKSGEALQKLGDMVEAQGGDRRYIEDTSLFEKAPDISPIFAAEDGYINETDTEAIGLAAMTLGAGRNKSDDVIDPSAGIILHAKTGDKIKKGETIAYLHSSNPASIPEAEAKFLKALKITSKPPQKRALVHAKILHI